MTWTLNARIQLRNDRVSDDDADRQMRTAAEILRRFDDQPGVVLADEVGMGKTYVALAVAVSVVEATGRRKPVVVMVPRAVAEKWPAEWAVFSERCLSAGHGLRASQPISRGSEFLKLLDDPPSTRNHLIFLTHGALTTNLNDSFMRLALLRRATKHRSKLLQRRRAIARSASSLFNDRSFSNAELVEALLESPEQTWRDVWCRWRPASPLADDPVPDALLCALDHVDLDPVRDALMELPIKKTSNYETRLRTAKHNLRTALNDAWKASLGALNERLPLIVLDEAHHLKNPNHLSRLFANEEAEQDAEALQGPLGKMFERMLFLTATPFQLGHHELLHVLDRFHGVRWPSAKARTEFDEQLGALRKALDRAQATALRFERAWSRIDPLDAPLLTNGSGFEPTETQPEALHTALTIAGEARSDIVTAEKLLQPWVIRHVKPHKSQRRRYRPGRAIIDDGGSDLGLSVDGAAVLPFLLAARAQALATLTGAEQGRSTTAYYAYGLASSFEAYADTRRNRLEMDDVESLAPASKATPEIRWYLDRIAAALPTDTADGWAAHPKVAATIERVRKLWCDGEKALVFCFYVETGRALRSHISRVLTNEILTRAAESLSVDASNESAVFAELDRIGERLLRSDSRGYDAFRRRVRSLAASLDDETQDRVAEIVIRFMRTPSFLVRFVDLSGDVTVDDLIAGIERSDLSGASLAARISGFCEALAQKVDVERDELFSALSGIQTGGIQTTAEDYDKSERSRNREVLLPNVRLANGGVRSETRRRLMLTFNSPFFPEVLVASSVMAEGVDLQQDCRFVIHHDLDWNPSTLEQRTGRVDRIGSKATAVGEPVVIYEPYVGGTHDEKMYRVVKDRERWFGVVMGETPESNELATERQENRVPLPRELAESLTMNLSLAPEG